MRHFVCLLLRGYQILISPVFTFLGGGVAGCRFQPTCSEYMLQAVRSHGVCRGGCLGVKRLCKCHPWGPCGEDPVPPVNSNPIP